MATAASRPAFERFISDWLSEVRGTRIENGKENSADPDKRVLVLDRKTSSPATILHESSHLWLAYSLPGYSNRLVNSVPDDLNIRGQAQAYRELNISLEALVRMENGLPQAKKPLLQKALGAPESYDYFNVPGADPMGIPPLSSWMGNLVDETRTLGFPPVKGHPMQNFHEFFASMVTTLSFDGITFFNSLNALAALAKNDADIKKLADSVRPLLAQSLELGKSFVHELDAFAARSGQPVPPQVRRLEANLLRLDAAMQQMSEPQRNAQR